MLHSLVKFGVEISQSLTDHESVKQETTIIYLSVRVQTNNCNEELYPT